MTQLPAALLTGLLALLAAQRLAELAYARHTARNLALGGARFVRDDGFGMILAVHLLWFVGLSAEGLARGATVGAWTWLGLGFLLGQGLRYASMVALGPRWNTRVWVLPQAPLVARGPYRFLRHPIYVGVFLELLFLPLALGLWSTAALVAPLHAVALFRRIRAEERALGLRA